MKRSINTKPGRPTIHSPCLNENGAALVIGLMFIAILGMLGTTAYVMTATDMQIGGNYKASVMALNDGEAGIYYAIGKIEEGLKAWPRTFTLPTSTVPSSPLLSSLTVPTGFGFTYQTTGTSPVFDITEVSTDPDIYKFTVNGTGPQNSSAVLEVECERLPAIMFGAFGDNKLEMKNDSAVYSYSHTTTPLPTSADTTGEGDVGSNVHVILNNNAAVDGNTVLGENAAGTDATQTDHGATVNGTSGMDAPRVDPDPLGVVGGEYATNFTTYAAVNANGTAIEGDNYYTTQTVGVGTTISLNGKDTLTLKGTATGANFYFTDIDLKGNSVLFIDTTDGPVNIYLAGAMDVTNGGEVVNLEKPSTSGCDGTSGACECATPGPPSFDCAPCYSGLYQRGAPSNFNIFSNSTSGISIGNSVDFAGLIYAPYAQVRFDNSVNVYGAVWGKDVELVANSTIYFDTDLKDNMESNDMAIVSWRDNRL